MTKSELISLLTQLDIRPSRKLGQNFLIDPNLLDAIVRDAEPQPGERILEVGPGTGALTRRLLDAGAEVVAVEQDRRLCDYLQDELGGRPGFSLIRGDAVRQDYDVVFEGDPFRCVSNLPYAISSPLIATFLLSHNRPREMYLLLQRETAQRIIAGPRTKAYGSLSVLVQTVYDVRTLRSVPPNVFYPPPEIASAHVQFCQKMSQVPGFKEMEHLHHVVRRAFSQRRKQLIKLLAIEFDAEVIRDELAAVGASPNARAEELTPEQFRDLARQLS